VIIGKSESNLIVPGGEINIRTSGGPARWRCRAGRSRAPAG